MLKAILISFFLNQVLFTVLDLYFLYRNRKVGEAFSFSERRGPLLFMLSVWIVYFLFQNLGTALLPGFHSIEDWILNSLGVSPVGEAHWTWKVALTFVWAFHVIAFWDFVTHRWVLHKKYFWVFHEYHHLPKLVLNGMPGISSRPFVFFTTLLTYAGSLFFLLWPLQHFLSPDENRAFVEEGFPLMAFFLTFILSVGHSVFLRQYRSVHFLLRKLWISSPHEHVLHHSRMLRCNYGNFSTIWDRLFKSYIDPMTVDYQSEPLGLDYDQDYLGTLCFGKFKFSQETRQKFKLKETLCLKD